MAQFADVALGKSVVRCKDSPGFIANRLGVYWLATTMAETLDAGLTVEEADAIIGRPMGIPKTGVFGLLDLVGLDLMPHDQRMASMGSPLPKTDAFHAVNRDSTAPILRKMVAEGYTGRKGKGGFYRRSRDGGGKVKEAIDLKSREYRAGTERPTSRRQKDLAHVACRPIRDRPLSPWRVLGATLSLCGDARAGGGGRHRRHR